MKGGGKTTAMLEEAIRAARAGLTVQILVTSEPSRSHMLARLQELAPDLVGKSPFVSLPEEAEPLHATCFGPPDILDLVYGR